MSSSSPNIYIDIVKQEGGAGKEAEPSSSAATPTNSYAGV